MPDSAGCAECTPEGNGPCVHNCRAAGRPQWRRDGAGPPHRVWVNAGHSRSCTCPLAGDHNPSAWRSPQALAEVGLTVGPGRLTPYTLCQSCGAFEHAHGRCPHDD